MASPDRQELVRNAVAFLNDPKVCLALLLYIFLSPPFLPDRRLLTSSEASVSGGQGVDPRGNRLCLETVGRSKRVGTSERRSRVPSALRCVAPASATLGLAGLLCAPLFTSAVTNSDM